MQHTKTSPERKNAILAIYHNDAMILIYNVFLISNMSIILLCWSHILFARRIYTNTHTEIDENKWEKYSSYLVDGEDFNFKNFLKIFHLKNVRKTGEKSIKNCGFFTRWFSFTIGSYRELYIAFDSVIFFLILL